MATIIKEAAEKWKKISNGRVTMIIYPGGVAGDDPDVVRKMRLGTLHAGVLTAVGVAEIDKSVYALGIPMMYASYDEVYGVLEKMRPTLEADHREEGFRRAELGGRGLGSLLHPEARGHPRRSQEAEALRMG